MTTLLEIKAAIEKLSPRDYAELMAMLHAPVDDDWDRQIKADATAGRLDHLVEEARADLAAGVEGKARRNMVGPHEKSHQQDGGEGGATERAYGGGHAGFSTARACARADGPGPAGRRYRVWAPA